MSKVFGLKRPSLGGPGSGGEGEPEVKEGNGESQDENASNWLTEMMRQAGPYMSAAYTLTGGLLGLGLLGFLLDRYLGTSPAFVLVGLGLGLVVGFYELAKVTFRGPGR